jgi:uncharacterized damage-inducible protein DinB
MLGRPKTLRFFGVCYFSAMSEVTKVAEQDARYPIGRSQRLSEIDEDDVKSAIADLAELPGLLRNAVDGLDADQLDTPYREGGWAVQQLVHHIADSHMNAFIRVRLGLTEDNPTITTYDERAWAVLHDSLAAPLSWSLDLVEGLHARWVMLLQSLDEAQWKRSFVHPQRGPQTIAQATVLYGWHSRHHVAHITHLRLEKGW